MKIAAIIAAANRDEEFLHNSEPSNRRDR